MSKIFYLHRICSVLVQDRIFFLEINFYLLFVMSFVHAPLPVPTTLLLVVMGSFVAQAGLKRSLFLHVPSQCWDDVARATRLALSLPVA